MLYVTENPAAVY